MTGEPLNRLFPVGGPLLPRELAAEARAEMRPRAERPHVFCNMVSSVDGAAAVDGSTQALGGEVDTQLLLELRAIADAVLVGTATLAAEGYDRLVRSPERRARRVEAGRSEDPPCVVFTRSGTVPWEAGLFAAPEQPVLVYSPAPLNVPEAVAAPIEVVEAGDVVAVLRDLRARGVEALLCEGGPTLLAALLGARALDELFLTLAPRLRGDDREPGILGGRLPGGPFDLELRGVCEHDGDLFLRYRLAGH